jgi:putative salt-induced outer membrane protein YdiY
MLQVKSSQLFARALFLAMVALATPARADVIVLKNGDRITGEISQIWDDKIAIEPEYSDEFKVDVAAVAYVESDREFEVEFDDGREVFATFPGADDEGNQLMTVEDQTTAMALDTLLELDEPEDYFDWYSNVQLNAAINKGNTDSENTKFYTDGMVKFGDHRHLAGLTLTREEQDGLTTKEQDLFRYAYNWLFNDPWFFAGGLGYERDPIKELDHRYIVSAGVGRDIWNTPRRLLNFTFGLGYSTEEIANEDEDSAVAVWRLRYRQDLLGDDLNLFHNHEVISNISGRTNTFIKTSTGVSYEISDLIYTSMSVDFDYETEPAAGADKEDLALLLGIGVEFE